MKVLVAIANHGNGNRAYLDQLLEAYRKMPLDVSLVVLSNVPKDLGPDVEVRVGVPSANPWSLPFAHRTLFRERLEKHDYFIYSEDDTLMTWKTLQAFLEIRKDLHGDEIPGFLRTEQSSDGRRYFSTCNTFFRWIPKSVCRRGHNLWAQYSNQHSACFVVGQEELRRAIDSGGFPVEPHEGRFDMLCSAATDIYTRCGLTRLVCIDRIEDFILPHLPNKYVGIMGLPEREMQWQIDALRRIHSRELPHDELLDPETLLPGCAGSKLFREDPDCLIQEMLQGAGENVLVWGAGDGVFEMDLKQTCPGLAVLPLNAIMGECCRQRGLSVLSGKGGFPAKDLNFDAVVLRDVLHLVKEPGLVLDEVFESSRHGATIVVRVPNLNDLRMLKKRSRDPRFRGLNTRETMGAEPFTPDSLSELVQRAGFGNVEFKVQIPERFRNLNRFSFGMFAAKMSPYIYLRAQKR